MQRCGAAINATLVNGVVGGAQIVGGTNASIRTVGTNIIVDGLTQMVRIGKGRSLSVFVGTLLPERAGGRASYPELVVPANDAIRAMVARENAILVDLYQAFGGTPDPLISSDGLHPNAAGNAKIADTFYNAIRTRLEIPSASALGSYGR